MNLKKYINSIFITVTFIFAATALSSCIPDYTDDEAHSIEGVWGSQWGEEYIINITDGILDTHYYAGNHMSVVVLDEDGTEGYIYIKYTKAYERVDEDPGEDSENGAWSKWEYLDKDESGNLITKYYWDRYSTVAPDVGRWYALYFYDKRGNFMKISGAWKNGGVSSTSTLDEAKKEFVKENGYFGGYSEVTKIK